jgi:hypothetical protein
VQVLGADEDEDLPAVGCAAGAPAACDPATTPGDALAGLVATMAVKVSTHARIATGSLPDPEEEARAATEAARREAQAQAEEAAQQAAQRVFGAPAPSSRRRPPRNPLCGRRAPKPEERAAARRLGQALRRAQLREPARTRVASAMPPGRLRVLLLQLVHGWLHRAPPSAPRLPPVERSRPARGGDVKGPAAPASLAGCAG